MLLEEFVCELIIVTPNTCMTDKAWVLISKEIVKEYRSMPLVCDNLQWMILELFESVGSHERVLEAHELRATFLVLSAKEESNTSHAIQGYNQFFCQ